MCCMSFQVGKASRAQALVKKAGGQLSPGHPAIRCSSEGYFQTSPTQWIVMIPLSRGSYIFHMKRNCAIQRSNNLVPIQKRCFVAQVRQITAKKYISFFNKVVLWQAAWTMWWSVGKFPPSSTSLPPTDSKKGITVTLPKTSYGPWVDIWQMFSKMHWQYKCRHFVHEFPCSTFTDLIFRDSYPSSWTFKILKAPFCLKGHCFVGVQCYILVCYIQFGHDEKRPNHRTAVKYWILCDVVRETFQTLP